jgi:hypothetical protein
MHERRLHPRAVVSLAGEMRRARADRWERVLVHDLSAGGAGILTSSRLPIQGEVDLRFELPARGEAGPLPIRVASLVVRSTAGPSPDPERPHLSGLHFLDLQGEGFDRVRQYVWDLMPED